MSPPKTHDGRRQVRQHDDPVKAKAFALLDEMSDQGLDESMIGTMLLGMAAAALHEGGKTRADVHAMVDAILDARGVA